MLLSLALSGFRKNVPRSVAPIATLWCMLNQSATSMIWAAIVAYAIS